MRCRRIAIQTLLTLFAFGAGILLNQAPCKIRVSEKTVQHTVYIGVYPPIHEELLCDGTKVNHLGLVTMADNCLDIPQWEHKALLGSAEDAEKLSLLFQDQDIPGTQSSKSYAMWTLIAAENGNPDAMFHMAVLASSPEKFGAGLSKEDLAATAARGEFWLKKASDLGNSSAASAWRAMRKAKSEGQVNSPDNQNSN